MDVRDIVLRSVPTVTVQVSLREVAEIMAEHAGSAVLVVEEEGKVLGVITEAVLASALSRVIRQPAVGTRCRSGIHQKAGHPAAGLAGRSNRGVRHTANHR
jgi:CBS-domain-containing membrane protein